MLARAFTQSSGIDRERDKLHLSDRCKKGEIACSVQPKPKTKTAQESTDDPTFSFAPWLGPTFHRKESEVLAVQCQLLKMVNSSKLKILIMTVRFETYILWPLLLLQRAKPLTNTYRGIVPTLAREIKALPAQCKKWIWKRRQEWGTEEGLQVGMPLDPFSIACDKARKLVDTLPSH